jgi:hypothetical protein
VCEHCIAISEGFPTVIGDTGVQNDCRGETMCRHSNKSEAHRKSSVDGVSNYAEKIFLCSRTNHANHGAYSLSYLEEGDRRNVVGGTPVQKNKITRPNLNKISWALVAYFCNLNYLEVELEGLWSAVVQDKIAQDSN